MPMMNQKRDGGSCETSQSPSSQIGGQVRKSIKGGPLSDQISTPLEASLTISAENRIR